MKYDPKTMQNYPSEHEGFTEHYNVIPAMGYRQTASAFIRYMPEFFSLFHNIGISRQEYNVCYGIIYYK